MYICDISHHRLEEVPSSCLEAPGGSTFSTCARMDTRRRESECGICGGRLFTLHNGRRELSF
jgi:hypothetical protein